MNRYIECLIIGIITFLVIKIIKKLFEKFNKNRKIYITFLKSVLQAIIIVIAIFLMGSKFETFKQISSSLVTGSTLIVAVAAFSLEEGITNLVHGFIISICKPFNIGDRLTLVNQGITGNVENITLRHTVIKNYLTGTHVLVPNAILDKEIIENSFYEKTVFNHNVDISIARDSDVEKAREIFKDIVINDERYSGDKDKLYVYIRNIDDNAIHLRAFVQTETLENNFIACSEIRRKLLISFKDAGIKQPQEFHKVETNN